MTTEAQSSHLTVGPPPADAQVVRPFIARGAIRDLFRAAVAGTLPAEVVVDGPWGTGKTRGLLELMDMVLRTNNGVRALILRKTSTALASSALATFRDFVLDPRETRFFGGSKDRPPAYLYDMTGSSMAVGGMDRPDKVLSTEYDLILVPECRELTEEEWETLIGRLRHGHLPYQSILGDCNPTMPRHWLKQRQNRGQLGMLSTRLRDNPYFWDSATGTWTTAGLNYWTRLDAALTGVRRARYLDGRWVAAEGIVYAEWDETVHVINRRQVPGLVDGEFPHVWPRDWSVDFGFINPFVWQQWVEDPDGRLYLEKEIYRSRRIVEDHCELIARVTAHDPPPRKVYCDHDAEDRATLERKLGVVTVAATKAVKPGIAAVELRLRRQGDSRPRLFMLADCLVERDQELVDLGKPASTLEEFDSYIWDEKREAPVKVDDHGMDALRYEVASHDGVTQGMVQETGTFDYRRGKWIT